MIEACPVIRDRATFAPPASRFIGRDAERAAIFARLSRDRLVTVWGPPGAGKTRVVEEVAAAWADAHPNESVCFAELAAIASEEGALAAIARALRAPIPADIATTLAELGPALVVLDGAEGSARALAPSLDQWLRAAPLARFLVTSRTRARVPGEQCHELLPLALPEEEDPSLDVEAAALFVDRARSASQLVTIGREHAAKVAAIVRALEGIPLAIEIAAAKVDLLGLDGLAASLAAQRAGAGSDALRDAIERSWRLLGDRDRRALARASVFHGGISLPGAEAVLGEDALDRIEALRDGSLLRAAPRRGGVRFSLYAMVQRLAEEKLHAMGDRDEAFAAHARYHLDTASKDAALFERTGSSAALARIADEVENLHAIAARGLDGGGAERAREALSALVIADAAIAIRGLFSVHLALLDRALSAPLPEGTEPALLVRARAARGRALAVRGQDEAARADLTRALEGARAIERPANAESRPTSTTNEPLLAALVLMDLGVLHHQRREVDAARRCYDEALAVYRREGARRPEARALGNLAALAHDERRFDEAMSRYEEALALATSVGDVRLEGTFSMNAGILEQERGKPTAARRRFERASRALDEASDPRLLAVALGNLGMLHHEEGRPEEARACHERAAALLHEVGDRRSEAIARARLGAAEGALDRGDRAEHSLGRAERLAAHLGDPRINALADLARASLDLSVARAASVEKRSDATSEHLEAARARIQRAKQGPIERSDDLRLMLRILERSAAASFGGAEALDDGLYVSPEARWVRAPGGAWQDMRERHAARRILARLIAQAREAPGRGVPAAELQEVGWPGERILPDAALNRIYVTMNQLRKLGLKPHLTKNTEGYALDPALVVRFVAVDPME